jgi:hypothetical protein
MLGLAMARVLGAAVAASPGQQAQPCENPPSSLLLRFADGHASVWCRRSGRRLIAEAHRGHGRWPTSWGLVRQATFR